ncbi:hypothetical protein M422DRAFT_180688 [Sphaerobolus stellatus SS14]|uniref:Elongator complex protein 5 n=1 Tax=Sphaerobolus stellatus (strain SS14) TaxID=990650 RepID=A0A0C9VDN2_SPHS4|nr:hypothetical protein M422DRAFT_180688 [Sphaerobolus stellatus SS14]
MAFQLSTILQPSPRSRDSLILIENTGSSPWLQLLQSSLTYLKGATIVVVCVLYPAEDILPKTLGLTRVRVVDRTDDIPGYQDGENGIEEEVLRVLDEDPVVLIVDSADTICEDKQSHSATYNILKAWHANVLKRPSPSRLILPLRSNSRLLTLLITPSFSSSLVHLILHPPATLQNLAADYLTLPPPHSPAPKFWPIFSGLSTRGEGEPLLWGANGAGWGDEVVVEILIRSASGKRTVDRTLEGWRRSGPSTLEDLEELKQIWSRQQLMTNDTPDPMQNLPFNLSLTEAQQQSRAQVPLPYAHEGMAKRQPTASVAAGSILYDPDSADDIDEDDPDEDLDI